jgi:hypothetical protein
MGKPITIDEELLWNTLHPFGMARFLNMFCAFIEEYDDDTAHRFGVGDLCGRLHQISEQLQNIEIGDHDWAEFRRRHPLTKQGER